MSKHYNQRGGFTLVEISIAVGVICVLTAILLPVIGHVRQSSRQTNCASNLQQVYIATRQYYEDQRAYPASTAFLMPFITTITTSTGTTYAVGGDNPAGPTKPEAIQSQPVSGHPTPTTHPIIPLQLQHPLHLPLSPPLPPNNRSATSKI